MRSYLIVLEVTVATLMIVGSGLVMKSYLNLINRDPGINTERLLTLRVSLPEADYPDDNGQYIFFRDFTERVRAIPGVVSASPVAEFPSETMTLAIKTEGNPGRHIDEVLAALASIDRDLPAYEILTMKDVLWQTYFPYASLSILFSLLTGIALVLSAVGIYGVVSYTVAQRIREFGIRIALGASRRNVIILVNRQMVRLAGTGLLIGLFMAFAGLRFMSSLLFGVSPTDPGVYLLTFVLMGTTALLSAYLPARKATRANPIEALREE